MQVNFTINIDESLVKKIKGFFTKRNTVIVSSVGVLVISALVYAQQADLVGLEPNTLIKAEDLNANFQYLKSRIDNLQGNKSAFAVGMIIPWIGTGNDAPEGWLFCDGTAITNPVGDPNKYDQLLALLPAGKTPDLRGRYLVGMVEASYHPSDCRAGLEGQEWINNLQGESSWPWQIELIEAQIPRHCHTYGYSTYSAATETVNLGVQTSNSHTFSNALVAKAVTDVESTYWGGDSADIDYVAPFYVMPPSYVVRYLIKATPDTETTK